MDSDSFIYGRRYHSRSDLYLEDTDAADEFLCPFCAEDYDVVSLCCHIEDDHPLQATIGVCPVCGKKVATDLVLHITSQHANFLKVQRKRKNRKGDSGASLSMLRKELQEGTMYLQSLLGGSTFSANSEPDPLLSSFMFNPVAANESVSVQPSPSAEAAPVKESSTNDFLERNPQPLQLSDEDQEEKSRRFDFVQGMLMSTILDDDEL